jgi:RNA polymerase sigma-70 factor (ECF subfamily)
MTSGDFDRMLAAAQAGGEGAFVCLYRELHPSLLRYLGAQAPQVAEDLAADTWLAVARQLVSFSGDERAFRTWLFSIARRQLIQHWRKTSRRRTAPVGPEAFPHHPAPDDPEASGIARLSAQEAAAALAANLSPDQADVVLLRVVGGLDVDQVAAILDKKAGTVRVLQHKALKRLTERFSQELLTG